jgi:phthiocerol/phenolphthiocerol synthesis type-I polyketide synthase E
VSNTVIDLITKLEPEKRAVLAELLRPEPEPIAIIGMACRFPGQVNTPEEFWALLKNGRDGIVEVPAERWSTDAFYDPDPHADGKMYTRYGGFLPDMPLFDSQFFGISPHEAIRMDPQQRLLLEVTWEALENAGQNVDELAGSKTGVFIGITDSLYNVRQLQADARSCVNDPYFGIGSASSVASGRLSYFFNFQGPNIALDTACSSSLVALHLACQSLRGKECNLAVIGGVNVVTLPGTMINACKMHMLSSDGRTKTFDAQADGYVLGEGCGTLVLKRMTDAQADGDNILAIIRGSAINEDGRSNSLTAPNGLAQQAVIRQALVQAKVRPHMISYVEAHGSGTSLGDPIEMEALQAVLTKDRAQPLMVGSVKTNLGHLAAGAGMAGLIKTVLALQHQAVPPHLNLKNPNPNILWNEEEVSVPAVLTPWQPIDGRRIAGVSSFGWSGTNVHVVLEEAPTSSSTEPIRPYQLLCLSARTSSALDVATTNLQLYLQEHPHLNLADVAYTLQVGRRSFKHRRVLVCQELEDALSGLGTPARLLNGAQAMQERQIVFMFPGIGDHYENMTRDLYELEPVFRKTVDHCCDLLQPILGLDLRKVLYASNAKASASAGIDLRQMLGRGTASPIVGDERLNQTEFVQPAVFVVEYALVQLLQSWGIVPNLLIGYSLGEYVAACISGVLSLENALTLVARRAQMIQSLPAGSMLAVPLSEADLQPYLNHEICLAVALNKTCVLGGPIEAIAQVEKSLAAQEIVARQLKTSHAFHSTMMEPIVAEFTTLLRSVPLNAPRIPYLSNVTGAWITEAEATDPTYWTRHLCQTVRFGDALALLIANSERVLLEVGAGQSLGSFVKQHPTCKPEQWPLILSTLRPAYEHRSDVAFMLETLGKLWLVGLSIDWSGFYGQKCRQRIPLPTYPFERQRYWIDLPALTSSPAKEQPTGKKGEIADWFSRPEWEETAPPMAQKQTSESWLIFEDELGWGTQLAERLLTLGAKVIRVQVGRSFSQIASDLYTVRPDIPHDYNLLLSTLKKTATVPTQIAHTWSITPPQSSPILGVKDRIEAFNAAQRLGFYSLIYLAQAIGKEVPLEAIRLTVLSNEIQPLGETPISPEKATILGPCRVIPQEYQNIRCRAVDIGQPPSEALGELLLDQLLAELTSMENDVAVAYRDARRYVQTFKPLRLTDRPTSEQLRPGGVYLITGGLGTVGLTLAKYLAQQVQAKLVLVSRSGLPEPATWATRLEHNNQANNHDLICHQIRQIQALEALGAEVLVMAADVTNEKQMEAVIERTYERFGSLHGVIHGAGLTNPNAFQPIQMMERAVCEAHFLPKVHGLYVLEQVLPSASLDFCFLLSSLSCVLGGLGFAAYTAANQFMDAYAHAHQHALGASWTSVNWDTWQSERVQEGTMMLPGATSSSISEFEMTRAEGTQAFALALASGETQLVNSTGDLETRIRQWTKLEVFQESSMPLEKRARPKLSTEYVPPSLDSEQRVAAIWQQVLGIDQVGIHDNFFELGGDSLMGMRLMSWLQQTFQVHLQLPILFEAPTIAEQAIVVEMVIIEEIEKTAENG